MSDYILPNVGASGVFLLKPPLTDKVNVDEVFTCQAVRSISEYESINDDVYTKAYVNNGLTQADYDLDRDADMHILSLQSPAGMWVYVPAMYVERYPDHNGVLYTGTILTVAIPPMPSDTDFDTVKTEIAQKVLALLGVQVAMEQVESTRPTIVTSEEHAQVVATRAAARAGYITHDVEVGLLQRTVQSQAQHIAQLEQYIRDNP